MRAPRIYAFAAACGMALTVKHNAPPPEGGGAQPAHEVLLPGNSGNRGGNNKENEVINPCILQPVADVRTKESKGPGPDDLLASVDLDQAFPFKKVIDLLFRLMRMNVHIRPRLIARQAKLQPFGA